MGKTAKTIVEILGVLILAPIWFFLLYTILKAIQPDRLVWFLFWVYVPLSMILEVISKIVEE